MAKHSHRDEQKPHDDALPHEHAPEKEADNDESSHAEQTERSGVDLVQPDEDDNNAENAKDESESSDKDADADDSGADPTDSTELPAAGHVVQPAQSAASQSKLLRFKRWFCRHKKLTIPGCIILALAVLAAVPFTRYWLAGLVLKQQLSVVVDDSVTNKPVSNATLSINGQQATTDGQGHATIKTKVGRAQLTISKNYYQSTSQSVLVPILKQKGAINLKLKATGRQVSVTVVNKLTKKPVASATIAALDTKASTDKNGVAVLVLPADKQTVDGTISANGYNVLPQKITVTTDEKANSVALTPSGNVYFLSDQSGTLDVVKTNLDGNNRKVVVAGTGKEDKRGTVLLASRDWKYLALLSKRDGGDNAKLYLIDTGNDSMITMDEGAAEFSLTGWSDHRFIYTVTRTNVQLWQDNRQALKSYDADSKSIATIDQAGGVGDNILTSYEDFGTPYILKNEIVYTTQWHAQQNPGNYNFGTDIWQLWRDGVNARKAELHSVHPDGSNARVVKSYSPNVEPNAPYAQPVTVSLITRSYEPQSVWILVDSNSVDEYQNGQAKAQPDVKPTDFWAQDYPTYLISPSSNSTFWSEARDGKETLLVGDSDAKNGQAIAKLTDYAAYGWYTDQYVLVTKSGSELYIMPAAGGDAIKLADYYKPFVNFSGYGYGYGGL